ncbi:phage tail protein [Acinetobacter johnsonii]|uniref:phage tail protein n=1 Tax=Acinetobacter johnsonii TaxID=40214 RepID=UPI00244B03E0|nr:phage tail protein [Acinetobacter johnsonii]MDH2045654.1 phage tail protein [Acinetobacter johnsonii]
MEFTWSPDLGAKRSSKPDVNVTKFNGYESRTPKSIHANLLTWSCTFTGNLPLATLIEQFLADRGGVESFVWTDPKGYRSTFVCREWDMRQAKFGVFEVSATFEEVFEVK